MDRIGVVGISWRQGGAEALAAFTLSEEAREARLPGLARALQASEFAYLATCNRVEVAFVADPGVPIAAYRRRIFQQLAGREPQPGEAERALRAWAGEGAVEHLFLVAAGLDSARPGETEIAGQFRGAYDLSRRLGLVGSRLELVFEHALRVAARVHDATGVGEGKVSLAEIALDRVRRRLQRTPGTLALVGVSPMTQRTARALAEEGHSLLVVNRTLARAKELASEIGGRAMSLADFVREPEPVEALVLATGSSDPVLDRSCLEKLAARSPSDEPPLVVDMAVPPDVDPEDAVRVGIERIGMNQVIAIAEEHRRDRLVELADARALVDDSLDELRRRIAERSVAPVLAALQKRYRQTAEEGVDRLLRRELKGLGEDEREAVRRWAQTLARRFAHVPTVGLRGLAVEGGHGAVQAFLEGLHDEDLARSLGTNTAAALSAPADEESAP